MTSVVRPIHFAIKGRHKRAVLTQSRDSGGVSGNPAINVDDATRANDGRVPRVSKLMALAIRFEGLLRDGEVESQSELAQLAQVTQPRMTQIMNLLHLAPEIQEEILFLEPVKKGRDPITERYLRPIAQEPSWSGQRLGWEQLKTNN